MIRQAAIAAAGRRKAQGVAPRYFFVFSILVTVSPVCVKET